ncbi:SDR family oxidoreductase [Otariodibacter sp.]|uniref:SDR family NAD(P)-dependent oxidoreductase n=1 Tax=Otariodibacter sp. TaxID=3030919 RepID=UPI002630047E|nr:SDR family oxidoreductase [Otariodibacter sp.]
MKIGQNLEKLFSLEDKVVLFTGAGGGIGTALSKGLAEVGAKVALCDLNADSLQIVEDEIKGFGGEVKKFILDLQNLNSIKTCVNDVINEFGKIDVLINCAGINIRKGSLDFSEENYDKIMNINLKGVFFMCQTVGYHMVERKSGSIINFASTNGRLSVLGGCAPYGMTKNGIITLTKSLTIELSKHGVRANAIAPGPIRTPLSEVYWSDKTKSEFMLDRIAMKRPGRPDELIGLIVLLSSDASSYMSGSVYVVDGGYEAGGQTWEYDTCY